MMQRVFSYKLELRYATLKCKIMSMRLRCKNNRETYTRSLCCVFFSQVSIPMHRKVHQRPLPSSSGVRVVPSSGLSALLWLLVLGILIGGAAIPHAQDTPRVVPQAEDERFCRAPSDTPADPTGPGR